MAPSEGLKTRVLAAATGRQAPRRALLSRVFWAAAAVVLLTLILNSLFDTSVRLDMVGTKDAPKAKGTVVWEDQTVSLRIAGLPALPAGKVYQLWHLGPKPKPVPCATFALDPAGSAAIEDRMANLIVRGHKFALTIEPAGGSAEPTMPIYAIAQ